MSAPSLPVVLCVDKNFLPGLHVTLYTALWHLSPGWTLSVHLMTDSLTGEDEAAIQETLSRVGKPFTIARLPVDLSRFRRYPWQGGWMTYARLIIPELLAMDRLLFLDADLLVLADISQLYAISLEGHALGAVSWNKIAESNDRSFFEKLGMSTEAPYFNAGVLLIDANQWRKSNIGPRCFEVLERYGAALPTMDQTVLNLVFYKSFLQLPRRFNTPVTASRPPLARSVVASRVIHLVAYPKPWDAFGFLNGQFELFQFWFRQTAYRGKRPSMLHMRNVRKIRAILKCLPNLLRRGRCPEG